MNVSDQITLGNRIKTIRQSLGQNQEEFANNFGVSKAAVSKWESDKTKPDNKRIKQIAELGGITVDALVNGDSITIENIQDWVEKSTNQFDGISDEEKAALNTVKRMLSKQLGFKDKLDETRSRNLDSKQVEEIQSRTSGSKAQRELWSELDSLYSERISDQDARVIAVFFKILNEIKDDSNSVNKKFSELIINIWLIASAVTDYDKDTMSKLLDEFLSEVSK